MVSVPLLGRVFEQLRERHRQGLEVSVSGLTDLSAEEMAHIAGLAQRQPGPVSDQALADCVDTVRREYRSARVQTQEDLLALQDALKRKKGVKG